MTPSSLGVPTAGSGQPQTAPASSAQPSLGHTAARAQVQHGYPPGVSQQPDQAPPQAAPHMRSDHVSQQPSSRLRSEAGPATCSMGMDAAQSGEAPAELLDALQNPQRASRSSWSQWAAQLRAGPRPAPPQLGTQGHIGQPATVQEPFNPNAHGQGYRQLPLVSSIRTSAAPQSASGSAQWPEQAHAPLRQMHHALEQSSLAGQRMQPAQQPSAGPVLAPQHMQPSAFDAATSAAGRSAMAHPSAAQARPAYGQQPMLPVARPAILAGNTLCSGFAHDLSCNSTCLNMHQSEHVA